MKNIKKEYLDVLKIRANKGPTLLHKSSAIPMDINISLKTKNGNNAGSSCSTQIVKPFITNQENTFEISLSSDWNAEESRYIYYTML